MQFLLPKTPNLKDYFFSLGGFKKIVFLSTLVFFVASGSFLALGVYSTVFPLKSLGQEDGSLRSPTDFFGRASKNAGGSVGDEAKKVPSPLNGVLYTEGEASEWKGRRPMAVMVNNHVLAWPQTGLSQADIIYEAVAEGGISRFLAVFHSRLTAKVGPVRSARKYYVDFAKENDAWYGHWGGASTANEANVYDYMRTIYVSSIDAMWAGAQAFWRDFSRDVHTEHTGYTSIPKLYETAYKQYPDQTQEFRDLPSVWSFKADSSEADRPEIASISFNFWDLPDFLVKWDYNKTSNSYKRSQGGNPHLEAETGEVLTGKDVMVLFMDERSLNDGHGHLLYKTIGEGSGKAFLDGKAYDIKWVRKSVNDRTQFYLLEKGAKKGSEKILELNRGQIWIEILPTGSALTIN